MKKTIAILLAVMTLFSAVGVFAEGPVTGGWTVAESTEISAEEQEIFDKAMEGLVGVGYEPIAYIGSQVVAGLNHCYLCKAKVVYPGAETTLALVYIYQDLEGNAQITNIADLDIAQLSQPIE